MINHSKPQQYGLKPAQNNGLIRIMVLVTGSVFLLVILLQVSLVASVWRETNASCRAAISVCLDQTPSSRKCSAIICFPFIHFVFA